MFRLDMSIISDKLHEIEMKLIDSAQGFELEDQYSCVVCAKIIEGKQGWYDKYGPKCLLCQKAIQNEVIPKEILLKRYSWLAMWEISQLGYHPRVIRMMMRKQQLKPRTIKDNSGRTYFYVFVIEENPILKSNTFFRIKAE